MSSSPASKSAENTGFFDEHGYTVLEQAISGDDARRFTSYALMNRHHPDYYLAEPKYRAVCRYGDVLGESLLRNLQPKIEAATGLELLPCYSFLRIYTDGAVLEPHIDRPACEVSATLTFGGRSANTWPIWLKEGGEKKAIALPPGHLLVYRGCQLEHWRDKLDGEYWVQLFIHYVTVNGEHANYRFDGRRGLGEPQNRQQQDAFIEKRKEFDAALAAGNDQPCFCHSGKPYSVCHGVMHQALSA